MRLVRSGVRKVGVDERERERQCVCVCGGGEGGNEEVEIRTINEDVNSVWIKIPGPTGRWGEAYCFLVYYRHFCN
jgi:hypothetical protein